MLKVSVYNLNTAVKFRILSLCNDPENRSLQMTISINATSLEYQIKRKSLNLTHI